MIKLFSIFGCRSKHLLPFCNFSCLINNVSYKLSSLWSDLIMNKLLWDPSLFVIQKGYHPKIFETRIFCFCLYLLGGRGGGHLAVKLVLAIPIQTLPIQIFILLFGGGEHIFKESLVLASFLNIKNLDINIFLYS